MMKKLLTGLLALTFIVPGLMAVEAREILKSTLMIDISKDTMASDCFLFYGGTLGIKLPARDSSTVSIECVEADIGAGAMPIIPGIAPASYILQLYMTESAGNSLCADGSPSGNTFVGAMNTSAFSTTSGIGGKGFDFDGTNDWLTRADDSDFDFAATDSFCMGFWIDAAVTGAGQNITWKYDGSGFYVVMMATTGLIRVIITTDDSDDRLYSTTNCGDGNPHLVIINKEEDEYLRIYVDGVQEGVTAISNSGSLANTANMSIGSTPAGSGKLDGILDGFFVISGDYPAANNVAQHYNIAKAALDVGPVTKYLASNLKPISESAATGSYLETGDLENFRGYVRVKTSAAQTADREFQVFYKK